MHQPTILVPHIGAKYKSDPKQLEDGGPRFGRHCKHMIGGASESRLGWQRGCTEDFLLSTQVLLKVFSRSALTVAWTLKVFSQWALTVAWALKVSRSYSILQQTFV